MIDSAVENQFRGPVFDLFCAYPVQENNGIVIDLTPKMRVEIGKNSNNFGVPGPPEVLRQGAKPLVDLAPRSLS